jgi:hypothetical protein
MVAVFSATVATGVAAATPATLAGRAAALADAISTEWSGALDGAGALVDPVTGSAVSDYGETFLAYGMLRATERDPALDLIPDAARALEKSDSVAQAPFSLLGLAESLIRARGALGPAATNAINDAVLSDPPFGSHAPGAQCYQQAGCYDNLTLVNGAGVLAVLAALPGRSGAAHTTFAAPASAAREALGLLGRTMPAAEIADGRLEIDGNRLTGAVLSDPTRDPTAYLALSAMMLGRALELAVRPPPAALLAFQRAIVALLGLTAPNGDISYMGRGQGQVWTMASAAAACALAMRLLPRETFIASHCEGVVDAELDALTVRRALGGVGIAVVPRLTWRRGVDPYVGRVNYNGLCVYALNLTADALQGLPDSPEQPIPGAESGQRYSEPAGPGLATTSLDGLWFAVHRENSAPGDSRWGFGLLGAQRLTHGTWTSILTDRPLGQGSQGPVLVVDGHDYEPEGQSIHVEPGRIVIRGGWFDRSRLFRAVTLTYEATAQGVVLQVPVRPGDGVIVSEWTLPGGPSTVSLLAPGRREVAKRYRVAMGNDISDNLDQIDHTVTTTPGGLIRVQWHG